MILELNNRLERLGLSVGLQTVLHVCPTTDRSAVWPCSAYSWLLLLPITESLIQTRSISTITPMCPWWHCTFPACRCRYTSPARLP